MDIPDDIKYARLKAILPPTFNYKIKKEYIITDDKIEVTLLTNILTADEANLWVNELQNVTRTTYKVTNTPQTTGTKVVYKQIRHCQHKTRTNKTNSAINVNTRNTNCPSTFTLTIKTERKKYSGRDLLVSGMPCELYFKYAHNHPTESADALRFRPVSEDVKKKLISLFHKGHSPATARDILKIDIQHDYPEDYEEYLADRFHCPDYKFCQHLYTQQFVKDYGPVITSDHKFLEQRLEEGNTAGQAVKWVLNESQVIIAICTPIMRRAHSLVPQSGELVFIDSSGTLDRDGHRIFLLLTHSEAGGIPLGALITNSESTATITTALQMYKDLVGNEAFFNRADGPAVIMTDDSNAERKALNAVWGKTSLLLCLFHILQAMWRWVLASNHGVSAHDRQALYYLFKAMVTARTIEDCKNNYRNILESDITKRYPNFISHVRSQYWERREEWALCYRTQREGQLRGINTNNFAEAAMRVLKDKIFERVKAFNLAQMVDFILTRLDAYYERKLLDSAHNRGLPQKYPQKWLHPAPELLARITNVGSLYTVPSEKEEKQYKVDMDIKSCECPVGLNGALCKHQVWVHLRCQTCPIPSRSVDVRTMLYKLATGKEPRKNWLQPLHDIPLAASDARESSMQVDAEEKHHSECVAETNSEESKTGEEEALEEGKKSLQLVYSMLEEQLIKSPLEFGPALKKMAANLKKMKTPAAVSSAVVTCGKVSASHRRRGAKILVQPTAIARRKTALSGRCAHVGGRPRLLNTARRNVAKTLPSHKKPAPHNLEQCVAKNVALGSAHSAKQK